MCISQVSTRILEAHTNVKDLSLTEAKLNYIKGTCNVKGKMCG